MTTTYTRKINMHKPPRTALVRAHQSHTAALPDAIIDRCPADESLLVGGIGIMNIMLVSVTERTREIGILIAVGARSSDILIQFLIEAVILSLSGGIIGVVTGIGIAFGLGKSMGTQVIVEPSMIIMSVGFTAAVGIFFGFYPAKKASALNPIEAMRYE